MDNIRRSVQDPSCIWNFRNVQASLQQQGSSSNQASDHLPEHASQLSDDVPNHPSQAGHDLTNSSNQESDTPTVAIAILPNESRPGRHSRRQHSNQSDRIPEVDSADTARLLQRCLTSRYPLQHQQPASTTGCPAI